MTADADGNPPKTTHVYVIGGSDENVANAIFNSIGLPGHTFGEVAQTVINNSGQERTIYFSRAKQQTVYVKVAIETTDSFDTDNGVTELKIRSSNTTGHLIWVIPYSTQSFLSICGKSMGSAALIYLLALIKPI
ncbi:hypothetical protein [Levilactobacillus brevis]|uniref:hypothetical protein n=1 Tax=Levilactobacillus brevis TaxID=1580 RepID=UPI00111AB18F|nr:hypothetical protein [Levilactobacillus brevis]